MASRTEPAVTQAVRENLEPLTGAPADYDRPLDLLGDARFALLGEASHGTQDFTASALKPPRD
jgi:erythromycin esterase-like protein